MPVKYKRLAESEFTARYPDEAQAMDDEIDLGSMQFPDKPWGEVKTPGGWVPCLITRLVRDGNTQPTDQPGYFFDIDDGWMPCPASLTYEEL